jgi:outer membrane protein TolC
VPGDPHLPIADAQVVLRTPLQVIAERPDVRAAEQRLRSAGATLRSTEAERYPQLSLSALVGQEATNWTAIGRDSSRAWSYGELLTMPIFEFGRIQAAIDQADAQQRQAYLTYEQTVRSALESTQSAIVLYTQGWARSQQLEQALKSAHIAATLARRQYQDGALALLNVLDTERTEDATELSWAEAAATVSIRLVTLYQAMGALPPRALPPLGDDTKY